MIANREKRILLREQHNRQAEYNVSTLLAWLFLIGVVGPSVLPLLAYVLKLHVSRLDLEEGRNITVLRPLEREKAAFLGLFRPPVLNFRAGNLPVMRP
jgi:hypothetical protein